VTALRTRGVDGASGLSLAPDDDWRTRMAICRDRQNRNTASEAGAAELNRVHSANE
jgi:hypothetical protein